MNLLPLKIGHISLNEQGTGLTVFLFDKAVHCGAVICGSAPGTREVIQFTQAGLTVDVAHGLLLTGGSAYGIDAASGVMQWLQEQGQGIAVGNTVVPIVPAACVFDLDYKKAHFPTKEDAYLACKNAKANNTDQGRIGAGTGTRVGKLVQNATPMFGGFGMAECSGPQGLIVQAYAVVNAIGDVIENGNIIAGAKYENGIFANSFKSITEGKMPYHELKASITNTALIAVFTNAAFGKEALIRLAKMGSGGLAQAVSPAFTMLDGDIVFCFSLGKLHVDELITGTLVQEAVRQAIVNAVKISNS